MKKTLVTLLVITLLFSVMGTVSFAAETTMTPIPEAPALDGQYVHMQADGSIKTPGYTDYAEMNGNYHRGVEPVCEKCNKNHCEYKNVVYNNGYFTRANWQSNGIGESVAKTFASYSTGNSANGVQTSRYGFHRQAWNLSNSVEIAFEKLGSDSGENITVDSGKLMLHNNWVELSGNYSSFGFGLVSGKQVGCGDMKDDYLYVAVVLEGSDESGWKSYLQFLNTRHPKTNIGWTTGGQYREIEISNYVKKAVPFDIKVVADLDADTYSIYIDNRPVVLSCLADTTSCPEIGGINFATTMVNSGDAKFATTSCYPMTDADFYQYKQAAWERAFNNDNIIDIDGTKQGILLFTAWGGEQSQHAPEFSIFYDARWSEVNWGNKATLKCDGVEGLGFLEQWTQPAGMNYNKVYLRGTNFREKYDYDKLELLILCGEPTVDAVNGTVSGSYIAAGGIGMQKLPRVISAAYTKDGQFETLCDAKITEAPYGVYVADFSELNIPDDENVKLVHYIWGGEDKLTPLFDAQILQDYIQ